MLEHHTSKPERPARVVVIGAAGFVGGAVAARLERDGIAVARLSRREVDLLSPGAEGALKNLLKEGDSVVAASAKAPVKNSAMLVDNMRMAHAIVCALASTPLAHVVNISSDAVYADSASPLTESSCAAPASLHGAMHLAREVMFQSEIKVPLAILRPSLLYGASDPHNGYGPNRFRRLSAKGEDLVLFGDGEERRDHVFIDDVAEIVARVLYRRSTGVLNIATGEVHSFADVAHKIISLSGKKSLVKATARSGPMPHNGYRPFDIAGCRRAFPDFRFTSLEDGLRKSQNG
jgi:nucleoside-diphosphate-sugar epimerase